MAETDGHPAPDRALAGWRRLGVFWLTVLLLLAMGTGVVEWLGPPDAMTQGPGTTSVGAIKAPPSASSNEHTNVRIAQQIPVPALVVGRNTPGPVTDPDPRLLEPAGQDGKFQLPRIAADGRAPMRVYAAGFDHGSRRPKVGVLLAGIGLNEGESDAAIRALPAGVSLAISPYTLPSTRLLATARTLGHEYLLALPLEPVGFPLNDPGPATLLTTAPPEANLMKLRWSLARLQGYVGATGIIGAMRGERLAAMTDQMDMLLSELSARGLLYVDPRENRGGVAKTWGRHVDLVLDETLDRTAIDAKLAALEQTARDHGAALGLMMRPTPVAVARVAAWLNGLGDRGMALAPVSALALAPAEPALKVTERLH